MIWLTIFEQEFNMANTDYDETRDGNLLVKASTLNAAFARYHQKYLQDKTSVMHYKGTKATTAELPASGNVIGDVWNVTEDGQNYAWDGTNWDRLSSAVDLNGYATESYVGTQLASQHDFGTVAVGSTNIAATAATDTLTLVEGSNVTLTPNAGNKSVTIAATDTTYSAATPSTSGVGGSEGLMSAADKEKLDNIAAGAEVNQNAFKTINIGTTSPTVIEADSKEDSVAFVAGSNVTITGDATNDIITITATDTTYDNATPDTYSAGAKTADGVAGLMSSADKYKVDSLGTAANEDVAASITNGGTGLTTSDQVYDHVDSAISTALADALTSAQAQDMIDDIWNPPTQNESE